MLGHKTNINKFKKIKIIPNNFSDHSGMKLEINSKKKTRKFTNMCKLSNILLNNKWVKEKSQEKLENILRQMKTKNTIPKPMGCSKSSSKSEVYSNTILPQETSQINNLTLYLKQLEKEEPKKTPKLAEGNKSSRSEQK